MLIYLHNPLKPTHLPLSSRWSPRSLSFSSHFISFFELLWAITSKTFLVPQLYRITNIELQESHSGPPLRSWAKLKCQCMKHVHVCLTVYTCYEWTLCCWGNGNWDCPWASDHPHHCRGSFSDSWNPSPPFPGPPADGVVDVSPPAVNGVNVGVPVVVSREDMVQYSKLKVLRLTRGQPRDEMRASFLTCFELHNGSMCPVCIRPLILSELSLIWPCPSPAL